MSNTTTPSVVKQNAPDLAPRGEIYSHTAKVPGLIFCSGQVPADAQGKLIAGDVQAHCEQCINNLAKALRNAGSSLEHLVKVNVYLKSMDDFAAINEVYERMIPSPKPARTCIQAGKLPLDTDIEIEAIATYTA